MGDTDIVTRLDEAVFVECEEGYPTDDGLSALRNHAFDPRGAARFLVHDFPRICAGISCCTVRVADAERDFIDRPIHRVSFSTGGWSGAEELINLMLNHFWIRHLHTKWERGGHYEFEVPLALLEPSTTERETTS